MSVLWERLWSDRAACRPFYHPPSSLHPRRLEKLPCLAAMGLIGAARLLPLPDSSPRWKMAAIGVARCAPSLLLIYLARKPEVHEHCTYFSGTTLLKCTMSVPFK